MPVVIDQQLAPPPPSEAKRKRWTRAEAAFLATTEMFQGKRYELINGELFDKMGQHERHASAIMILTGICIQRFGGLRVRAQLPMDVRVEENALNEPEPDIAALHEPRVHGPRPGPAEVAWLIEVADSSLSEDKSTKAGLYARAGIPDYWVLDIRGRRFAVFRDPHPATGIYHSILSYAEDEPVSPLAAPDLPVLASQILPPAA